MANIKAGEYVYSGNRKISQLEIDLTALEFTELRTLASEAAGKGLGRALLAELLAKLQAGGVRKVMAVIGDSANAGSVGVHTALGFERVGIVKSCGWKFDRWLDIVLMEKTLGEGDSTRPE